jgi:hypothetical protein
MVRIADKSPCSQLKKDREGGVYIRLPVEGHTLPRNRLFPQLNLAFGRNHVSELIKLVEASVTLTHQNSSRAISLISYFRSRSSRWNSPDSARMRWAASRVLSTSSGDSLRAVGNLLKCLRSVSSFNASNFTSTM